MTYLFDKIQKKYVSEIDQFLQNFDETHDKSPSQLREIAKHDRIFKLRDDANAGVEQSELWEGF